MIKSLEERISKIKKEMPSRDTWDTLGGKLSPLISELNYDYVNNDNTVFLIFSRCFNDLEIKKNIISYDSLVKIFNLAIRYSRIWIVS